MSVSTGMKERACIELSKKNFGEFQNRVGLVVPGGGSLEETASSLSTGPCSEAGASLVVAIM